MHIGFITPEYPHKALPAAGGLGTSIKNLAHALVQEGVEVSVFVIGLDRSESFIEDQIQFHFIQKFKVPGITWFVTRKYYQNRINKIVESNSIDLLEAPDWTGITAFMKFRVPLIIRCHGSDAYFCKLEGRKQKWKNFWFEKNALKNADEVIAASSFTGRLTKEIFEIKKEIITLYNGVDINKFKPATSSFESEENSILYFGTVIRKKGVLELAKAYNIFKENNPDAILKIIGKDTVDIFENKSTLEMFYSLVTPSNHKSIQYLNHISYSEISKEISKAKLIVLPSFAEAFPMTWLEAMAMEKALVTSNIGWANEMMIDGETGYMVNPKDHKEFAEKMTFLFKDDNLRNTFGENARKRVVSNFSSEITTSKNIKYYQSLISK